MTRFEPLPVHDLLNHGFDRIVCTGLLQLAVSNTLAGQIPLLLAQSPGRYRFRGFYGDWGFRCIDITLTRDLGIPRLFVVEVLD